MSNFIILYDCINHNKDLSKQFFLSFIWKSTLCEMICWRDLLCRLSLIYLLMNDMEHNWNHEDLLLFFLYHNWKAHYLVYFYCDEHSIFQNFFILFYFLVIIDEYMGAGNQSKSLCPIKPLVKLWALVKSILQSILPHMGLYFINLVALGFTLHYVMRWRLETLCLNPLVSYQIFGRS